MQRPTNSASRSRLSTPHAAHAAFCPHSFGNGAVVSVAPRSRRAINKITRCADRVHVLLPQRIITGYHNDRRHFTEIGKAEPVLQFVASPGW